MYNLIAGRGFSFFLRRMLTAILMCCMFCAFSAAAVFASGSFHKDVSLSSLSNYSDLSESGNTQIKALRVTGDKTYYTASVVIRKGKPLWVVIGDSYCTSAPFLPRMTMDRLKVSEKGGSFMASCHGGFGIGEPERNFHTLLMELPASDDVTDVLFFGGIRNDFMCTKSSVMSAFRRLIIAAKKRYPNARIMYAAGNWQANKSKAYSKAQIKACQKQLRQRLKWYKEACKKNGVYYLSIEKTLRKRNNRKFFAEDGHHPSTKGKKLLSQALAKAISKLDRTTKVQKIVLNVSADLSLAPGETFSIKHECSPTKALHKDVMYTSSDPYICSVNQDGLLTALSPGNCRITCTALDGSCTSASFMATVEAPLPDQINKGEPAVTNPEKTGETKENPTENPEEKTEESPTENPGEKTEESPTENPGEKTEKSPTDNPEEKTEDAA